MKKLWRRAIGIIKDRNSLWMTTLNRRRHPHNHPYHHRSPELEAAVIKATSHDDTFIDYDNARLVFTWVKTSPSHLAMFLWALTRRVDRTRDWVVALKCLILFHGVICTKAAGVNGLGRLPFDLSGFEDSGGPSHKRWARSAFVRAYFAFLDAKSAALASKDAKGSTSEDCTAVVQVKRWQDLLDSVLQVQPWGLGMAVGTNVLVYEAMDGMLIEVFDLYSKICDGIAESLMKTYTEKLGKSEASMALEVLKKATRQGQELEEYFEFCSKIGLLHETEIPKIERIPDGDFVELERIIRGTQVETSLSSSSWLSDEAFHEEGRDHDKRENGLKTVVTDKWEMFDDQDMMIISKEGSLMKNSTDHHDHDPFAASVDSPPLIQLSPLIDYGGIPANSQLLISFFLVAVGLYV